MSRIPSRSSTRHRRWSSTLMILAVLPVLPFAFAGGRALAQSEPEQAAGERPAGKQTKHGENAPAIVERLDLGAWTCAMHPQIRQTGPGKCPICAMDLVEFRHRHPPHAGVLGTIDELVAAALHGSAEVRAAEARLHVAEAELNQARLHAVERAIEYRRQWRARQAELQSAEMGLQQAEKAAGAADGEGARRKQAEALVAQARLRVQVLREQLAETEAVMPLLFAAPPQQADVPADRRRKLIEEELLPKAEAVLKTLNQAYRQGESDFGALLGWSQRVAELKRQLARTPQEQIAALEAHRGLLEDFRAAAQARYRAGEASAADVLAAEYQLSEMKLRLLELRGE